MEGIILSPPFYLLDEVFHVSNTVYEDKAEPEKI